MNIEKPGTSPPIWLACCILWISCLHAAGSDQGQEHPPPGARVLFDDFDYTTAHRDTVASLFGINPWHLSRYPDGTTQDTRAWYWYNWYDPGYNRESISQYVDFPERGTMRLTMPAGFTRSDWDPTVVSGFTFKQGTFAAHVRFGPLERGIRLMQAFWTVAPIKWKDEAGVQHRTEMDFEWNNWFTDSRVRTPRLHATNHGHRAGVQQQASVLIDCLLRVSPSAVRHIDYCTDIIVPPERPRYYTLKITYDEQVVTYAIKSAPSNGGTVWGGGPSGGSRTVRWNQPVVLADALPAWPSDALAVAFSQHLRSDATTTQPHTMWVDWFYYSAQTDLSVEDVEAEVAQLRQTDISRLNTTGRGLEVDHAYRAMHDVHVTGPRRIRHDLPGRWMAHASLRWTDYRFEWRYRKQGDDAWSDVVGRKPFFSKRLPRGSWEVQATVYRIDQPASDTLRIVVE